MTNEQYCYINSLYKDIRLLGVQKHILLDLKTRRDNVFKGEESPENFINYLQDEIRSLEIVSKRADELWIEIFGKEEQESV